MRGTPDLLVAKRATAETRQMALDHARLTGPQLEWVSIPWSVRLALWRAGNQLGKSYAQAWDLVHTLRHSHPYKAIPRGPIRALVVSESWTQMDPLCEKIWELIPRDEIHPKVRYVRGQGFQGFKNPVIPFTSGPGRGGFVAFATYRQGPGRIAGGSFHEVLGDEPMTEEVYGEIIPRLARFHGPLRLTFTPTPKAPPQKWLRRLVADGVFHELQTSLNLDALTIRGGLAEVPWKTQAELDEWISGLLEVEVGMRVHGDWDRVALGRWFTAYDTNNETDVIHLPEVWIAIGIDHGAKAGRQSAALVACSTDGRWVWYLDGTYSDGRTSSEDDAAAILEMLDRNSLGWENVDHWIGDRAHGGDQWGNQKSNDELLWAFSELLEVRPDQLRARGLQLHTPYKRKGSTERGVRLINGMFKAGQAMVYRPQCGPLIEAIKGWEGDRQDPLKDRLDAARYATEALIDSQRLQPKVPPSAFIY